MKRFLSFVPLLLALIAPVCLAFYSSSGPVTELTPSNFKSKIKAGGVWIVEFYAPWCGHCKALKPEYEKAAKALKGIVNIAAVDCDQHKEIAGEYGIQGFPTIKLMYEDGGQIKTQDYNGGRTAKDIASFALEKAKALAMKRLGEKASSSGSSSSSSGSGSDSGFYAGTDVVVLTDGNFDNEVVQSSDLWLVEFYAPWCGHCKALKPAWIEAATEVKGKFKIGAVDCTAHQSTCSQFNIKGYPTIKFFGANKQRPEDYQGGRDSGSIVSFATQKWAAMAPPPEVKELVDAHVFETQCTGDASEGIKPKQLCFMAFLPDILDSKASGRNAYIKTLKKLAEAFKDRPFSYLWAQGGQQAALEANFGVGGFGYPALIAFNPKDKKYSTSKTAFEFGHVKEWIDLIRKGGESVASIQGSMADVVTVTPWDGKDAEVPVEDEFSLDDIMGDDDKEEL